MKTRRWLVLLLLAMLLPLRGLSAATLLCEQPSTSHAAAAPHVHGHDVTGVASHDHPQHEHDHGGFDKGQHCLSSCSAPPLLASPPTVAAPPLVGVTVFPRYDAPAPTFESDGPERPPRTI